MAAAYEPLQRYARRRTDPATADDVVADALLAAWRRLDDIDPGMEVAWCLGAARRCLANARRGDRRRARLHEKVASQPAVADPPIDATGRDPELEAALAALSDDERELIRLWAFDQCEPREIALVLGITANAVSIRLHRTRRKLAELVDRKTSAASGHSPGERTMEVDHP